MVRDQGASVAGRWLGRLWKCGSQRKGTIPEMAKYKCRICNYIYDPELGDPDGGIKQGTPFEEIPDDWVCPVCGAAKSEFERIE